MKSSIRTLRLTAATAVALVLMTGAAQARPMLNAAPEVSSQASQPYAGTYRPVAPATNVALAKAGAVALAPDRVDRIGAATRMTPQGNVPDRVDKLGTGGARATLSNGGGAIVVHTTSTGDGFDWTDAAIGAGAAILVVLILGGAGMTFRGRRRVALSS